MRSTQWLLFIATTLFCYSPPIIFSAEAPSDLINKSLTIADFPLTEQCPAGFEKVENQCWLRSLYQQYDSLYNRGVGGLKTALPPIRQGFTPQQIQLGKWLFFDPILSANHQLSCATCHQPDKGFADGQMTAIGINHQDVGRASPSLWNVGFLKNLFWDSRAHSLEEQMQGPLYSAKEMANTPSQMLADLNNNSIYQALFQQVYSLNSSAPITLQQVYTAIAAFESSLISLNSRYDQYAHGFHDALTDNEKVGLNVFRSFVARCAECHTPPLFTNQQIAVLGTPEPAGRAFDIGAEATFNEPSLRAGFKVPSLRNVHLTAPYMHSGVFNELKDAVSFYNQGRGHAAPAEQKLTIHWHIWEPNLTEQEIESIVEFLATLTDQSLMPKIPQFVPSGLPVLAHPQALPIATEADLLRPAAESKTEKHDG